MRFLRLPNKGKKQRREVMLDANRIDRNAFKEVYDQILSVMESMETDKLALKNLKAELGSVIGAESTKETNALLKALLKKQKDDEFYDSDLVATAQEFYDSFIED